MNAPAPLRTSPGSKLPPRDARSSHVRRAQRA
jgi:hypothetical protein